MSIDGWPTNKTLGATPCATARESWQCPNMLPRENDRDMSYEHYECKVCGKTVALDYEEMK